MKYAITIPTMLEYEKVSHVIKEIEDSICDGDDVVVFASCKNQSASLNRNLCFEKAGDVDVVIMCDDDVRGFERGWYHGLGKFIKDFCVVSARLLCENGIRNCMMDYGTRLPICGEHVVLSVPTACVAFRRDVGEAIIANPKYPTNTPFDTRFESAEYEDTDFCIVAKEMTAQKCLVTDAVKVVHLNEEKWRAHKKHDKNQSYFYEKHRGTL